MIKIGTIAAVALGMLTGCAPSQAQNPRTPVHNEESEWKKAYRKHQEACERLGQPRIGTTWHEAVKTCWGMPQRINTTETAQGRSDQFVYEGRGYLYFDNGVLKAIQR